VEKEGLDLNSFPLEEKEDSKVINDLRYEATDKDNINLCHVVVMFVKKLILWV
jgi:hypothetical protein